MEIEMFDVKSEVILDLYDGDRFGGLRDGWSILVIAFGRRIVIGAIMGDVKGRRKMERKPGLRSSE